MAPIDQDTKDQTNSPTCSEGPQLGPKMLLPTLKGFQLALQ